MRVGEKNPSLGITVCHHSASLVMPNGDPQDRCFSPTLTLMVDSYNLERHPQGNSNQTRLIRLILRYNTKSTRALISQKLAGFTCIWSVLPMTQNLAKYKQNIMVLLSKKIHRSESCESVSGLYGSGILYYQEK